MSFLHTHQYVSTNESRVMEQVTQVDRRYFSKNRKASQYVREAFTGEFPSEEARRCVADGWRVLVTLVIRGKTREKIQMRTRELLCPEDSRLSDAKGAGHV